MIFKIKYFTLFLISKNQTAFSTEKLNKIKVRKNIIEKKFPNEIDIRGEVFIENDDFK